MLDPLSASISLDVPTAPAASQLPRRRLLIPANNGYSDDYILELDYSSLSDFLCCARRGENKLIRGREGVRPDAATAFGKLFHSCEELRLRHGLNDAVKQAQKELVASHFLSHPVPPDEYRTAARMIDVLKLYNDRYASDGWPEKVLQVEGEAFVERPYKIELCSIHIGDYIPYPPNLLVVGDENFPGHRRTYVSSLHIILTGKIDAVLTESNLLWVPDHKTTSRGGREFSEAFRLSLQTRGYCWATQKILGSAVAGLLLNAVVVRPVTRTGTATELFRQTYFYSQDSLAEYESNLHGHISTFISMLRDGAFPQTALSFKSPCSDCDYQDNCALPFHQRAADLASSLYRDVTWSPMHEG